MITTDEKIRALLRQMADPRTPDNRAALADFVITARALLVEIDSAPKTAPHKRLIVFAPHERNGLTKMTRAGVAFENRDGTITVKLDVLPLGGELHVRAPLGGEVA